MRKRVFALLTWFVAILAGLYVWTYAWYRFANSHGVIDHVGIFRHTRHSFTFADCALNRGKAWTAESFSGPSIVSRLSAKTGTPLAPAVNRAFTPLMWLDHLFTGRWIEFSDDAALPVFAPP
ncbi:hypothetical protein OKA04_03415 [Luteolibacter flavescens]|uniref:Uncharacterized protein n=1 Tax=Luteolibacter flavescens TaxID=1859460 RepID=A0ABT3FJY9_9BACT|nr:hypothetical protein [Luteolibacter flavescens]MCW1883762.1 hypothetical protein [Luteolibacter flavescens]